MQTILHTVNLHIRGREMSKTQRHCRDPMESKPFSRNINILKIGDGYIIEAKC